MEIEFCFSSRIHTAILESNFSKIFSISLDRKAAPVNKNSKAVAPNPKANAKLAEELKATAQSNRIQSLNYDESAKHEHDDVKMIKSQPNPVFQFDVKASPNCNRSTSAEKDSQKRRSDREREPEYGHSKKARTIVSKVSKREPFSMKAANEARIRDLAEVILLAADDVIRTLGHNQKNHQMASQAPNNVESLPFPHIPKIVYDKKIFEQSWPIRKFMESLHDQPDYGEEVEENILPVFDDEEDFDVHYGSISNP